eukprot:COSAG02_NODE_880_length_16242_cov_5.512946_3_plen_716_part_00
MLRACACCEQQMCHCCAATPLTRCCDCRAHPRPPPSAAQLYKSTSVCELVNQYTAEPIPDTTHEDTTIRTWATERASATPDAHEVTEVGLADIAPPEPELDVSTMRDRIVIGVWTDTLPAHVEQDLKARTTSTGTWFSDLTGLDNQYMTALTVLAAFGYSLTDPSKLAYADKMSTIEIAQGLLRTRPMENHPPDLRFGSGGSTSQNAALYDSMIVAQEPEPSDATAEERGMQLFLRTIAGGKTVTLDDVKAGDPILSVLEKAWEKTGIPIDQQQLLFDKQILEDRRCVATYGLEPGSELRQLMRLDGGKPDKATLRTISAMTAAGLTTNNIDPDFYVRALTKRVEKDKWRQKHGHPTKGMAFSDITSDWQSDTQSVRGDKRPASLASHEARDDLRAAPAAAAALDTSAQITPPSSPAATQPAVARQKSRKKPAKAPKKGKLPCCNMKFRCLVCLQDYDFKQDSFEPRDAFALNVKVCCGGPNKGAASLEVKEKVQQLTFRGDYFAEDERRQFGFCVCDPHFCAAECQGVAKQQGWVQDPDATAAQEKVRPLALSLREKLGADRHPFFTNRLTSSSATAAETTEAAQASQPEASQAEQPESEELPFFVGNIDDNADGSGQPTTRSEEEHKQAVASTRDLAVAAASMATRSAADLNNPFRPEYLCVMCRDTDNEWCQGVTQDGITACRFQHRHCTADECKASESVRILDSGCFICRE